MVLGLRIVQQLEARNTLCERMGPIPTAAKIIELIVTNRLMIEYVAVVRNSC